MTVTATTKILPKAIPDLQESFIVNHLFLPYIGMLLFYRSVSKLATGVRIFLLWGM